MKLREIPIVAIGPGSQPEEADGARLECLDMPRTMATYEPPPSDALVGLRSFAGAWEALQWLESALADSPEASSPKLADLSALTDADRRRVNELLGEGEVSIQCSGPQFQARIQESILTGVWRVLLVEAQGHRVTRDILEVGPVPHLVRTMVPARVIEPSQLSASRAPADVINARSILVEVAAHAEVYTPGDATHVVNLTLLPMSEADLAFLDQALGGGAVSVLSRSYGNCEMTSTAVPNVWRIRYYNSMGALILNSIEIVDVPLVACAAAEDLADSAHRLADLLMSERQLNG